MRSPAPAAVKRVRALAVALANLHHVTVDETANLMLPRRYADCLIASTGELVVAPYPPPGMGMAEATRGIAHLCRSDVVAVTLGVDGTGYETPYFGVVRDIAAREWLGGYRFWCRDRAGPYWLVPDEQGPSFQLSDKGVIPTVAPWSTCAERDLGITLGHLVLIGAAIADGYQKRPTYA